MISYKKNRKTMKFRNLLYNARTGEQSNPEKRYCICGHSINFYSNHSSICTYCGRKVYPTKDCEFKEKLELQLKKNTKGE